MNIKCVWEHNGNDTLLYAADYVGAFTRGSDLSVAKQKMEAELKSYASWCGLAAPQIADIEIVQDCESALNIKDADSDVLFDCEKSPLSIEEYESLKLLALKSAKDFLALYNAITDKSKIILPCRGTFYGKVPQTAEEMYLHTKNVNAYYFGEIGIEADNLGDIEECRKRGFELLEKQTGFLCNALFDGSYGEQWTLRKLLRRFIWHDRIHAKAMYRAAVRLWDDIPDVFFFKNLI